jgi:hypothetical protein
VKLQAVLYEAKNEIRDSPRRRELGKAAGE